MVMIKQTTQKTKSQKTETQKSQNTKVKRQKSHIGFRASVTRRSNVLELGDFMTNHK